MKTDNELIAEFMGAEEWTFSQGEKGHSFWNKDSDGRRGWFPDGSTNKLPDEFKYDTSWDWLMPVVQKVRQLVVAVEIYYSLGTVCKICYRNNKNFEWVCIEDNDGITAVYKTVVEFIKWYNDQKK